MMKCALERPECRKMCNVCRNKSRNRHEKIYRVLEKQWHMLAVISASLKAVMMANMLMLVMLVGGWR